MSKHGHQAISEAEWDPTHTFATVDLSPILPEGWEVQIIQVAKDLGRAVLIVPPSTSRHDLEGPFKMKTVDGNVLRQRVPWLLDSYHNAFATVVGRAMGQVVGVTAEDEYAAILNIIGTDADPYEPHVDNNGATLVLPVTDHPSGAGGELAINRRPGNRGFFPLDDPESAVVHPRKGQGIIFDGSDKNHFVNLPEHGDRVTVIFEYYTKEANENHRPDDLSAAIGLRQ